MALLVYQLNSQVLQLPNLRSGRDGTAVTNATVTGNLVDSRGDSVTGFTSVSFTYNSTSLAYEAEIPSTFSPAVGSTYTLQITASDPNGWGYYIEYAVSVKKQQS